MKATVKKNEKYIEDTEVWSVYYECMGKKSKFFPLMKGKESWQMPCFWKSHCVYRWH